MKGQWVGEYSGSNNGSIVVDIDELPSCFVGVAYLNETNPSLPKSIVNFITLNKEKDFQFRTTTISPVNPTTGLVDVWDSLNNYYSEVRIPEYADVTGSWDENELTLSWSTNVDTHGTCVLPRSSAAKPSEITPIISDWKHFRNVISGMKGRTYIFRGQNEPWRLRTSFHRAERFNLNKFLSEDIQMLHKHLSARTKHTFNLNIPNENGAFFNLVQHHGYPTPLLDWTYSPYVAAFFAYRGITSEMATKSKPEDRVRLYAFNIDLWKNLPQSNYLSTVWPHVSIGEFMAVENERMIPQQAVSLMTNVDDIEKYIKSLQTVDKQYLYAIDLPVSDRDQVVQELEYMGITAGSLFPGLDGACEELRERNFRFYK